MLKSPDYGELMEFYRGKRVLITGHSGFKGSWLTRILTKAGATVCGYSTGVPTDPALYELAGINELPGLSEVDADVRDLETMKKTFVDFKPEIVFHLAAKSIVSYGYQNPTDTYTTNLMGIMNVLECIRLLGGVKSFLNVTSDKVYMDQEWEWGYREADTLNGLDPYSNSKSCSELITHSYRCSFFKDGATRISTARAGNVIGGGDFAANRIIPDCVRIALSDSGKRQVVLRNPQSVRPYQYVLDPLFAYLLIAKSQYEDDRYVGSYNVGPIEADCVTTGDLADMFINAWNDSNPEKKMERVDKIDPNAPFESNYVTLDCGRIQTVLGWRQRWHIEKSIKEIISFTEVLDARMSSGDNKILLDEMDRQINEFVFNYK